MKTDDKASSCDPRSTEGDDEFVTFVISSMKDACDNDDTKYICGKNMEQMDTHQSDIETN